MPHVIVNVPDQQPRRVELEGPVVVGRMPPAELVVGDAKVSRKHCRLSKSRSGWTVTDLGSSNGTRIKGRVVKAHVLREGDRIEIGRTVLVFEEDPAQAPVGPVLRSTRDRRATRRRR